MNKNYVMESPAKSDSDPDGQMKEDSKMSSSEGLVQDTQQKEDHEEEEAAERSPDTTAGSSKVKKKRKKVKPGEVLEDEIRAPDAPRLRQALTRPDKGGNQSNDPRKTTSEESMQAEDAEQREVEAAESGLDTPGGSSKDSTESEESDKERKKVKPGEVMEDEIRAPDAPRLRQALTRPDKGGNQSNDSRKTSSEESMQAQREEAAGSGAVTPGGSSKDSDQSKESEVSDRERRNVNSGNIMEGERRPPDGSQVRQARVTRPERDIDNLSIEVRVGDSRAPSTVPSPSEIKAGGDSDTLPEAPSPHPIEVKVGDSRAPSTVPSPSEIKAGGDSNTLPEAPSPHPIEGTAGGDSSRTSMEAPSSISRGPTGAVDSSILRTFLTRPRDDVDRASIEAKVGGDSSRTSSEAPSPIPRGPTGAVDSSILRTFLTRPRDDVDRASIAEVTVGDSTNTSEGPSAIEEIEEGLPEEARVQDLTSEGPPESVPPSNSGPANPLMPAPTGAQAVDTNPNEDSAVTTNETSIESISTTPPASGDEIRNEEIIVQAQYFLAPRRPPTSTDDTSSSEGIPDVVGNGVRYVYSSSEGEMNNEDNPDVPLPRLSPEPPEDIPAEENEPRTSSSSSAASTSSNCPNSTRYSGSSTNSTSSSAEEGSSNEATSTKRRSTDTRPDVPDTGSNEALPRIMEATTEEEEAAAADSAPTTPEKISEESEVHEADSPVTHEEPLAVTITASSSSIPPPSSLTGSPVSHGTRAQISPASKSTVTPPKEPSMPALIPPVAGPSTSTSTSSSSPQNPIMSPNSSISVPPVSISDAAPVTAPASSVSVPATLSISATSESSTLTSSAPSITGSSGSETGSSNTPVAASKRKITPAVEPTTSPQLSSPQLLSGSGAPPASPVTPPAPAPPSVSSPPACSSAGAPAVGSPLRSPVPKKRQRQQYHEGVPPSAAVTLSGIPCIDPNELRPEAPTPRQGTKRRTSGTDEAAVAGPSGSGHGGWRSKRSREDEDDDIPELDINPRPVPPVHKISDDDSGAESGDELLGAVTPPNHGAASEDDDVIAGIAPLMPRRPPDQEDEDPKKARIIKNQETDIEIMKDNVEWLDGFGLKFVGGSDTWIVGPAVVVYDIAMESPAFDDRRIIVGDQIRAVSGVRISEDMTYSQILELLSVVGTSQLLTIYRPDPIPYDRIVVTLKAGEDKADGDNFGLRLNTTILFSNFGSMYIDGFDDSSVADLDGQLKRGDFIETINDLDMLEAAHPNAAFALCSRASNEGATIVCKRFKI